MPTYDDLIRLAKLCVLQARGTLNKETAVALCEMAEEYYQRADALKVETEKRARQKVA